MLGAKSDDAVSMYGVEGVRENHHAAIGDHTSERLINILGCVQRRWYDLHTQAWSRPGQKAQIALPTRVIWVLQNGDTADLRRDLLEELQPFAAHVVPEEVREPGHVRLWSGRIENHARFRGLQYLDEHMISFTFCEFILRTARPAVRVSTTPFVARVSMILFLHLVEITLRGL